MGKYTITTRLEGKWRWATVVVYAGEKNPTIINRAQMTLQDKLAEAEALALVDTTKEEDAHLWRCGGVTLTDPDGNVLWARPVQAG